MLGLMTFQMGVVMLSKRWGSYTYMFLGGVVFRMSPALGSIIYCTAGYYTLREMPLPPKVFLLIGLEAVVVSLTLVGVDGLFNLGELLGR